jgi:hypothetical protein
VKLQSMRPRVAFGSSSRHESYVRLWRISLKKSVSDCRWGGGMIP